ncbi:arylsulfatase [Henriciella aquimarina]|uniref:arylsulfatase n=1 Tax=Henriciella aquimarina TaxID=545261 RepID=UPI001F2547DD|nr:arylsulfatase [Henriciella aquimarina]
MLRIFLAVFFTCLARMATAPLQAGAQEEETGAPPQQPNFVILLIDDAAFMDLGVYGGEARTPNIDALAARGMMFTRYYTSPLCAPSRAMLLTGMDNHRAGVGTIGEIITKEQKGEPGYSLELEPGVLTIAARLKAAGYRTLMTGKWHLGHEPDSLPSAHGFDRSFALDASGADNWEDKPYMPYYREAPWYENGETASLPDDFYSSRFIVDRMIDYLGETEADKPFLAYLGFQAIHIPVQAPPEFTANYDGVYDEGWQALREHRWQTAKSLGLIPATAKLEPMPSDLRPWAALDEDEQALYAARMEVNAGMLEAMDHHVGRLIEHLKQQGLYENTVFIVTSDNGPEPSRGDNDWRLKLWMKFHGYHLGTDDIGEAGSWAFIGPEWSMAAASPGNLFKFYSAEGGIHVPLIIAGPGIAAGMRQGALANVTDLAPTLLDLAGATAPMEEAKPMTGRSLAGLLRGEAQSVYGPEDPLAIEVSGNSALIRGDHKITRNQRPFGDGEWRLYDVKADPGEVHDLSDAEPELMQSMLADYETYAREAGVIPVPDGFNSRKQISRNTMKRQLRSYWWILVGALILLAGLVALVWMGVRRLVRR